MALIVANGFDWSDSMTEHGFSSVNSFGVANIAHRYPLQVASPNPRAIYGGHFAGWADWPIPAAGLHTTIYMGWAFRQGTGTHVNSGYLFDLYEGAAHHLRADIVAVDASNMAIAVTRGTTPTLATSSNIPILNIDPQWQFLEWKIVLSDTVGEIVCRFNDTDIINATGLDTRNAGAGAGFDLIRFHTGFGNTSAAWPILDDFYFATGDGVGLSGFVGDCIVDNLFPNGNGTYSQLLGSDGNSTDNYLLIDEPLTTNDADYVGSATDGQKDLYTYSNLPAAATDVKGIVVRTRAYKNDTGAKSWRRLLRSGGVDYTGADKTLAPSAVWFDEVIEQNPNTSALWTPAEINALEIGAEVRP